MTDSNLFFINLKKSMEARESAGSIKRDFHQLKSDNWAETRHSTWLLRGKTVLSLGKSPILVTALIGRMYDPETSIRDIQLNALKGSPWIPWFSEPSGSAEVSGSSCWKISSLLLKDYSESSSEVSALQNNALNKSIYL